MSAVGNLLAYGQEESSSALTRQDRDDYQFWQGWNAALERAALPVVQDEEPKAAKDESLLMAALMKITLTPLERPDGNTYYNLSVYLKTIAENAIREYMQATAGSLASPEAAKEPR